MILSREVPALRRSSICHVTSAGMRMIGMCTLRSRSHEHCVTPFFGPHLSQSFGWAETQCRTCLPCVWPTSAEQWTYIPWSDVTVTRPHGLHQTKPVDGLVFPWNIVLYPATPDGPLAGERSMTPWLLARIPRQNAGNAVRLGFIGRFLPRSNLRTSATRRQLWKQT